MVGMAWIRKWTLQNAKDKTLAIQDHIESIGKANTIKKRWGVA